jgi:hypothetical protein
MVVGAIIVLMRGGGSMRDYGSMRDFGLMRDRIGLAGPYAGPLSPFHSG